MGGTRRSNLFWLGNDAPSLNRHTGWTGVILTHKRSHWVYTSSFLKVCLTILVIAGGFGGQSMLQDWHNGNPDRWFMTVWMVGWAFGIFKVVRLLLWLNFGRERLRITNHSLRFKKTGPILSLFRRGDGYDAKAVTGLRWQRAQPNRPDALFFSRPPTGSLQLTLEGGEKSHTLFTSLTEAEAQEVIADIVRNSHVRLSSKED